MILRITIILFIFLLSQPSFSSFSIKQKCQDTFANIARVFPGQFVHKIINRLHSPLADYVTIRSVMDKNDLSTIRGALSVDKGDGAAIVNIHSFPSKLVKKIRKAIHKAIIEDPLDDTYFIGMDFRLKSYKSDWETFENWLLSRTKIISSKEIQQFKEEVDQYLYEIKQTILKTDGVNIEPVFTLIRTEIMSVLTDDHRPNNPNHYLISNTALVGSSAYYQQLFRGKWRRILSRSGDTLLLSGLGRVNTFSESGLTVMHGTPARQGKRLILISVFEKTDNLLEAQK